MDIYNMQYNYRSYYLLAINDGDVYVYNNEKYKFEQPFLSFNPKHIFIGKSKLCPMTEFSDAVDGFDGNTILLDFENNKYIYISRYEIFEFKTDDKIIDYISLMGNNMVPYAYAIGEKYTYFIYHCYKSIENDKIEEGTLLNATDTSLDPFDYHLETCGRDVFWTRKAYRIHGSWPDMNCALIIPDEDEDEDEDEDNDNVDIQEEVEYNGDNDVVRIFNQKCVICLERDSEYTFKHCGHQCICDKCYQNKDNIDIQKCFLCRK